MIKSIDGSFDSMIEMIRFRVVNSNEKGIDFTKYPHRTICDLSIVYTLELEDRMVVVSGLITYDLMNMWGIDQETLHLVAMGNMIKDRPIVIENLEDTILGFLPSNFTTDVNIWAKVITNKQRFYGFGAVFYPGVLESIWLEIGNFYLIPSSKHEAIAFPKSMEIDASSMQGCIKHVNRTMLEREDILSDNLYSYDRKHGKLKVEAGK